MLARTIELARNLGAQRVCGSPAGEIPKWAVDEPSWEEQVRLTPLDAPIEASIHEEDGMTTVSIDDRYFEFAGTSSDADTPEFRCWGVTVTVT
jgi:hypothetical protein